MHMLNSKIQGAIQIIRDPEDLEKQLQGMTASLGVLLCVLREAHLRKCAQHH